MTARKSIACRSHSQDIDLEYVQACSLKPFEAIIRLQLATIPNHYCTYQYTSKCAIIRACKLHLYTRDKQWFQTTTVTPLVSEKHQWWSESNTVLQCTPAQTLYTSLSTLVKFKLTPHIQDANGLYSVQSAAVHEPWCTPDCNFWLLRLSSLALQSCTWMYACSMVVYICTWEHVAGMGICRR